MLIDWIFDNVFLFILGFFAFFFFIAYLMYYIFVKKNPVLQHLRVDKQLGKIIQPPPKYDSQRNQTYYPEQRKGQQPPPPPPKQPGVTVSALKRGSLNTASDFTSTAALIAEAIGSDEFAESFRAKAEEFSLRAAVYRPTVGRVEDIRPFGEGGAGDTATFLVEKLVENAPMLATLAIPGGIFARGAAMAGATAKGASAVGATAAFLSDVGLQTGESATIAREEGVTPVHGHT